jgi:hypothetical protein
MLAIRTGRIYSLALFRPEAGDITAQLGHVLSTAAGSASLLHSLTAPHTVLELVRI